MRKILWAAGGIVALGLTILDWVKGEVRLTAEGLLALDGPTYVFWSLLLVVGLGGHAQQRLRAGEAADHPTAVGKVHLAAVLTADVIDVFKFRAGVLFKQVLLKRRLAGRACPRSAREACRRRACRGGRG